MKHLVKNILLVLTPKERKNLWVLTFFDILISILDIAALGFLIYVINFYTQTGSSRNNSFLPGLFKQDPVLLISSFFIFFCIKNYFGYWIFKQQFNFVYRVSSRISANNLASYLDSDYNNYVNTDSSVHIRKISQEPIEFGHYVLRGYQQVMGQLILVLITMAAMLIFNATLFFILFGFLLPPVVLTAYIMKRKLATARRNTKQASERSLQHLYEALSGFIESNIYDKHSFFKSRYHSFQQNLNKYLSDQQVIQGMPSRVIEIFAVFGLVLLVVINNVSTGQHAIQVITLGAFMAAAYKIIPGIVKILNSLGQIKTYEFTIHRLLPANTEISAKKKEFVKKIESARFNEASFQYNDQPVLKNFSMEIHRGDMIGISGISGKGKTTILNLLLGFLEPTNGSIDINEKHTNIYERAHYRKTISYVKQQPFLIHDSILKNITLNESEYDQKKLLHVIRISGLQSLIDQYDEGLEYVIQENGKNISGGQRQRITIARALYKDFDLLILDEPFKELDNESEFFLLEHLKKLSEQGKMIILVAHNKSSFTFCNKIVSLDDE